MYYVLPWFGMFVFFLRAFLSFREKFYSWLYVIAWDCVRKLMKMSFNPVFYLELCDVKILACFIGKKRFQLTWFTKKA